jgi:ZIP family zinc transporter
MSPPPAEAAVATPDIASTPSPRGPLRLPPTDAVSRAEPPPRFACLLRRMAGVLLTAGGLLLGIEWLCVEGRAAWLALPPLVRAAGWGGLLAAGATAIGTLPVLVSQSVRERHMTAMLGFSAGVMLAASVFSLLIPACQAAAASGLAPFATLRLVLAATVLGAAALYSLDRLCHLLSQAHTHGTARSTRAAQDEGAALARQRLRCSWLFVVAIVLHNVPEGLSIGLGYAGTDLAHARALAAAIALQDLPEGLVVALALRAVGYGRSASFAAGAASGLVEPVAALAGAWVVGTSLQVLPGALAAAAGAMLFAILHAIAPLLWRGRHRGLASAVVLAGVVLMTALDNLFSGTP